MDASTFMPLIFAAGVVFAIILGLIAIFKAFYVKIPQGWALIINDLSDTPKVKFTGGMAIPVIHKKEYMKISLITLEIDRRGKDGLICNDNMRADITVAFYLRVNETQQDVLKVAKAIGVDRASDKEAVNLLFNAKFSEALKTVGKQMQFVSLFEDRLNFREKIIEVIGNDLNGYALEDVAIDYLEQTPKEALDPHNIMDAEGIRKITELTAEQNICTNESERNEELAIKKKNVETTEAMLALERQQADAEARQKREVESIQAREEAETTKVREEERLKSEQARIITEQDLMIQEENKNREIEVAEQNRLRAVTIEVEKVRRAKELEVVAREREVELQRIDKEKALEEEKTQIANVIRERISVEKTVAEEEERIKEVRQVSAADREKQVLVITAQAEAEEKMVKEVTDAQADEAKAKHKAVEINTMAAAELEAAAKQAEAKKKLAEGKRAELAATGLAEAQVREALADAIDKEGAAEASANAERLLSDARGEEEKGLAKARVTEAMAAALEKEGLAEAKVLEEKLHAQAVGEEELGLAKAKADKEQGLAAAEVIRERFKAEADGLVEKFNAMNSMTDTARDHEEFRMHLEKHFEETMASIEANKEIAKEQSDVLAAALAKTKIDIVGGEGDFFNSFAKSLSVGKAIDGVVEKSPVVQQALQKLMAMGANRVPNTVQSKVEAQSNDQDKSA